MGAQLPTSGGLMIAGRNRSYSPTWSCCRDTFEEAPWAFNGKHVWMVETTYTEPPSPAMSLSHVRCVDRSTVEPRFIGSGFTAIVSLRGL